MASPTITTQYTLTVSNGICADNVSSVTVSVSPQIFLNAGRDTIIKQGTVLTLNGSSSSLSFYWLPDTNIKYRTTLNPDVFPSVSTKYILFSEEKGKCKFSDTILVAVIPSDSLIFYSAFTPNFDGDNDYFFIGNIEKYPDNVLKIYNRYGQLIFTATSYANNWDGKYLSIEVPTGTYYYILDDGKNKKYQGTVTILR